MTFEAIPEQLLLAADGPGCLLSGPLSLPTLASLWLLVPHPQSRGESGPVLRSSVWPQAVLTGAASPSDTHLDTHPVACESRRVSSDHLG